MSTMLRPLTALSVPSQCVHLVVHLFFKKKSFLVIFPLLV